MRTDAPFGSGSGTDLLEALVGRGFAAALQDGLSRSFPPAPAAVGRTAPPAPDRPRPGGRPGAAPRGPLLLPGETRAILRRFEERLPVLLGSRGTGDPLALRPALVAHARRLLGDAAGIPGTGRPPTDEDGAGTDRTGPDRSGTEGRRPALDRGLAADAGVLLVECALLHVMAVSAAEDALPRAAALVGTLGRSLRDRPAASGRPAGGDHDEPWRECRRAARTLHDEIGTQLSVALHRLELHTSRAEDPEGHLATAGDCLRSALGRTRELVTGLAEASDVPPLEEAVRSFAAQASPGTEVRVTARMTGDEQGLPQALRRELLLAVRQCLHDGIRRARATRIAVVGRVTRRWVHISVRGDGDGTPGLRTVSDRIEDLGGRVAFDSAPGRGTRIDIHLPLGVGGGRP
ncbi:sensor histidine kinase [Streptomyces barkulensis]|uniref:sensor histidine kinase n=1 Tax=Streptomyces barkulensis TaxID=1257026 RepID=UPI00117F65AA|nr:histidine kinase [Streptomyces barkulensis]